MIVAGVGCRSETPADELERVVRMALGLFDLPVERLDALATASERATERAFAEAARRLSVKWVACTVDDLDRVAGRVLTPSRRPAVGHARGDGRRDLRHRHRRGTIAPWARGNRASFREFD